MISQGLCACYPGYAGQACEACATGYVQYNGKCLPAITTLASLALPAAPLAEATSSTEPLATWVWIVVVCGSVTVLALVVAAFYMGRYKTMRVFTEVLHPRMSQAHSRIGGDARQSMRPSHVGVLQLQDVHNRPHSMVDTAILDDPYMTRRVTGMPPQGSMMIANQDHLSPGSVFNPSFVQHPGRRSSTGGGLLGPSTGGMIHPNTGGHSTGGLRYDDHSVDGGMLTGGLSEQTHHVPIVRVNPQPTVHMLPARQSTMAVPQPSSPMFDIPRMSGHVESFGGSSPSPAMGRPSGAGEFYL